MGIARPEFDQVFQANLTALINQLYGQERHADPAISRVANWFRAYIRQRPVESPAELPNWTDTATLDHLMQITGPPVQAGDLDHVLQTFFTST